MKDIRRGELADEKGVHAARGRTFHLLSKKKERENDQRERQEKKRGKNCPANLGCDGAECAAGVGVELNVLLQILSGNLAGEGEEGRLFLAWGTRVPSSCLGT